MKKQYHMSEVFLFKRTITAYHGGELVSSETMWVDDADEYADQLEEEGYIYGYTQDEVDEAKRVYEDKLSNLIDNKSVTDTNVGRK